MQTMLRKRYALTLKLLIKIKGKYNAWLDITTDFYGRQIAKGDQLMMTLNM